MIIWIFCSDTLWWLCVFLLVQQSYFQRVRRQCCLVVPVFLSSTINLFFGKLIFQFSDIYMFSLWWTNILMIMTMLKNKGTDMWFLTFKIISLPVPSRYPTRQALVIAQIADEHWNARFAATSVRRLSQNPAKSCKWDDIVSRTSCWLFWVPHSMPLIIISNTKEDTFKKIAHPVPPQAPYKKSAPAC